MMSVNAAAIDLGATSGRVILGRLRGRHLALEQVARFANDPVDLPDGLHWDLVHLYQSALGGLRIAAQAETLHSVGIDSWAVDYGLLTGERLVGLPYHYRDTRTGRGVQRAHARIDFQHLYERNGLQFLPFNTLYQLCAEDPVAFEAGHALLIPDLLAFWLTGQSATEATNASTTGLLDPRTGAWDTDLMTRLGIPVGLLPDVVPPGTRLGSLRKGVAETVAADVRVVTVASHDTASAVAAVPMDPTRAAYISAGTWGLVGVELTAPVLTATARDANFTNEGGIDRTTRFLRNVMGLWMLSETLRAWERQGRAVDLVTLLDAAAAVPAPAHLIDVDDAAFLAPGDMPTRIATWLAERGWPVPDSAPALVRLILESLADAFARTVHAAARLSGVGVERIHLVGGGCQNTLLCQLTANRAGLPVVAGPVEATAIGNLLVQARAAGAIGDLDDLRDVVARSFTPVTYSPRERA